MESDKKFLLRDKQNGVLRLIIDRPKVNALNFQILSELKSAFNQAAQEESIRCVLISGAGEVFSAGHDVLDIANAQGESYRDHLQRTYNPLILQMRSLQKPIIAAIMARSQGQRWG
jgi:2-(1,2-epoxy-1,2-dihydrophenyl)acetyl-CoA isomerase